MLAILSGLVVLLGCDRSTDSQGSPSSEHGTDPSNGNTESGAVTSSPTALADDTTSGSTLGNFTASANGSDTRDSDATNPDSRNSEATNSDTQGSDAANSDTRGSEATGDPTADNPSTTADATASDPTASGDTASDAGSPAADAAGETMCPDLNLAAGCHDDNPCQTASGSVVGSCDRNASSPMTCGGVFWPNDCASDSDCGEGRVCEPVDVGCQKPYQCVTACTDSSCGAGRHCELGHCTITQCDDESGPECGEGFRCNSAAAGADALGCEPEPCTEGNYTCATGYRCAEQGEHRDGHGCAPIHCSEAGGLVCPEHYACNPEVGGAGCAVIPCSEPGGVECSVNSRCSAEGTCAAQTCTTWSDCDCGYCVYGTCSARPGQCQYFAP